MVVTTPGGVVRTLAPLTRTGDGLGGPPEGRGAPGGTLDFSFSQKEEYVDGAVRGILDGSASFELWLGSRSF